MLRFIAVFFNLLQMTNCAFFRIFKYKYSGFLVYNHSV